jgi:hypothetical protein
MIEKDNLSMRLRIIIIKVKQILGNQNSVIIVIILNHIMDYHIIGIIRDIEIVKILKYLIMISIKIKLKDHTSQVADELF